MKKTLIAAGILLAAVCSNGCGTFCNFTGSVIHFDGDKVERPAIYGGVQFDFEGLRLIGNGTNGNVSDPRVGFVILALGITDVFTSAVGDTLTLPITLFVNELRVASRRGDPVVKPSEEGPPKPENGEPAMAIPVAE